MKLIEKLSDDFVYCVSVTGTTGARKKLFGGIKSYLKRVKSNLKKPYVVGFGISTAEDVKKISKMYDGVVVRSSLIQYIEEHRGEKDLNKKVKNYINRLKRALN